MVKKLMSSLLLKTRKLAGKVKRAILPKPNAWLKKRKGVIHVGANTGQEREVYAEYNLDVLWFEPIPNVYDELVVNLKGFDKQIACKALLTDHVGKMYDFHVANNHGASSSILDLDLHKEIWPQVKYQETLAIESTTLDTLLNDINYSSDRYDALIMDTQGSELLVLKGAELFIKKCNYIQVEAADFEAYKDCCKVDDIDKFLSAHNFKLIRKKMFAMRDKGGSYYDLLYKREK